MAEPESIDDFLAWMGVDYFEAVKAIIEWQEKNDRPRAKRGRPPDSPWTDERCRNLLYAVETARALESVEPRAGRRETSVERICEWLALSQPDLWGVPDNTTLEAHVNTMTKKVSKARNFRKSDLHLQEGQQSSA